MKTIPLTQGKHAMVDDEDFDRINSMGKWQAHFLNGSWYACISKQRDGRREHFLMHRVILGLKPGEVKDHRDRDGLNNQKHNLRPCNHSQNRCNRGMSVNNTSGFIGLSLNKRNGKWKVFVKHRYYGIFDTKIEAARKYNEIASQLFGEFAVLNPETDPELPDDGLPDEIRNAEWSEDGE